MALSLALEEERLRIQVVEAKGSAESLSQVGAGDKRSDTKVTLAILLNKSSKSG